MSNQASNQNEIVSTDVAKEMPPPNLLRTVLASTILELPASQSLARAARHTAAIWPATAGGASRFMPSGGLTGERASASFWIYLAGDVVTAIWEGRFCETVATMPGRFVIAATARDGFIARLGFGDTLRFFDLSGTAASKLGIYDELRSPDYAWCQRLGAEIDRIVEEHRGTVHGFAYPSRRHPGKTAYAISSRVRDALAAKLTVRSQRFADTNEYADLIADPCHIAFDAL